MLFITSIIPIERSGVAPGNFKYSSANMKSWILFWRAHGSPTHLPSQ